MKTLVLFYSYNGSCERYAQRLAADYSADLQRIEDAKRPGLVGAYTAGCFNAMRQKPSPIQPFGVNPGEYDKLVLVAPVWAGHPAPPFNAAVNQLPRNKDVEIYLISASGSSGQNMNKVIKYVEERGLHVKQSKDIKASAL